MQARGRWLSASAIGLLAVLCWAGPVAAGPTRAGGSAERTSPDRHPASEVDAGPCSGTALAAFGSRQRADLAGDAQGTVVLTNLSTSSCRLAGGPVVGLIGSLGVLSLEQGPGVALVPVVLSPSGSASFTLKWSNWCGARPGTVQISLDWPDGTQTRGPFETPPASDYVPSCLNKQAPATVELTGGYRFLGG